jgi:hypothetical protein
VLVYICCIPDDRSLRPYQELTIPFSCLLLRLFMCHPHPRFISMTIKSITDQLVGHTCLEHELCCLIIRRLRQVDTTVFYTTTEGAWRHWFEVDFSASHLLTPFFISYDLSHLTNIELSYTRVLNFFQTAILAGDKAWDIKSVQD